jgi:HlyD family secretion protein
MKNKAILVVVLLAFVVGGWAFFARRNQNHVEVEYRYAAVATGELVRSISATGQVVALTQVDVKSKAGGKIVRLAVDEGSIVRRGDVIAVIDPEDTRAIYAQAAADVAGADARTQQARKSLELQLAQNRTSVDDARVALEMAKTRLERARLENRRQPALTQASLQTAQANHEAAVASMNRLENVTIPQLRRDAQAALNQARASMETTDAELKRQQAMLEKGYVAGASVERARAAAEGARSAHSTASQRMSTIEAEISAMLRAERLSIDRARAALEEARANTSQTDISRTTVAEAERAVKAAEVNLQKAMNERIQGDVRRTEVQAAQASTVRSRVTLDNARVQLASTTVLAPRDGVVTMKYLEEGTIIPPGTSTFAQGTSIVQISDVTQLYVECAVDEADIGQVRPGQAVRIVTEAFPGKPFDGVVERVNPAAVTENNITAVKVRVKVLPGAEIQVMPGMNATCEFITLNKPDVVLVPSQAVRREEGKAFVRVKSADPLRPETREVEVGATGNEGVEVLSGLNPGEEVVVAEIDLAALRETQRRMQEAQEGGGLAGGQRPGMGGRSRASTTGGTGGGAR